MDTWNAVLKDHFASVMALSSLFVTAGFSYLALRTTKLIELQKATHDTFNSKMDMLLKAVAQEAELRGNVRGRKDLLQEQARDHKSPEPKA